MNHISLQVRRELFLAVNLFFGWQDILNYAHNLQRLKKKDWSKDLWRMLFSLFSWVITLFTCWPLGSQPKLNDKSRIVPSVEGTISLKLPAFIPPPGSTGSFAELWNLFKKLKPRWATQWAHQILTNCRLLLMTRESEESTQVIWKKCIICDWSVRSERTQARMSQKHLMKTLIPHQKKARIEKKGWKTWSWFSSLKWTRCYWWDGARVAGGAFLETGKPPCWQPRSCLGGNTT